MSSKYLVPEVSDIIIRKRLTDLLAKHGSKNVFIILGQAAQGKSTLAASFLNIARENSAWINLDPKESVYENLFYLLSDAVGPYVKESKGQKEIKLPQLTLGTRENISRYTEAFNALLFRIQRSFNLVLDDLDSLDEDAPSFDMIKNIISSLPDHVRLFLISRKMPPLGINRLKMENRAFVVDNEELAFTYDETALFLKVKTGEALDEKHIEKVHAVTEGWVGGVVLLSETIRRKPDMEWLSDDLTGAMSNYFSKEVFALLPDDIKDFLMKASFFDEIDAQTATAFTGSRHAKKILNDLEKRNLFIHRTESRSKGTVFRFHKLFKTFLASTLKEKTGKKALKKLNVEAAKIYQQKGNPEKSIQYFAEGEDFNAAGDMIKKIGTDFIIKGRFTDLRRMIEMLPRSYIREDPWLLYYLTMTRRIKGGKQNITDFQTVVNLFKEKDDMRGMILSTAYLIETAVFMSKSPGYIAQWIAEGEALLKSVKDKSILTWARAVLWQQIGFGHIAGDGEVTKGISACQNAIILGTKIGNIDIQLDSSIVMILGYIYTGSFHQAEQRINEIRNLTRAGLHPEYRALRYLINIDLALKKGDFEKADYFLDISEKDIENFGLLFLYPGFIELKTMHRLYTKQYQQALQLTGHLSDFSILSGNSFYKGVSHRLKAVILYHTDHLAEAELEAYRGVDIFKEKRVHAVHYFMAKLIYGLVLTHNRKFESARNELSEAFQGFEESFSDLLASETKACLGLLNWEQNDTEAAAFYILDSIKTAAREKYRQFTLMRPEDFTRVILLAVAFDSKGLTRDYTSAMVSSRLSGYVGREADGLLKSTFFNTSAGEAGRLKRIFKYCLPRIRIESLGRFNVFIHQRAVKKSEWEGNKPKLLLKSIICHNGQDIPKEMIIEDIWPGKPLKSGEKSFKVTLHRLRRTLEGRLPHTGDYSYVQLVSGRISLDPEIVSVDVDDFNSFCAKGGVYYKEENYTEALFFYEKAAALYRGDFFAEEPYTDWIEQKRAALKQRYIDILMKKAEIHEEINQSEMAINTLKQVIENDPLLETAYQNLMIVYADSGMINSALTLFEQCKSTIKRELETGLDSETIRIHRKIKSIQN